MGFYNYIIDRLYSWALNKENDTPIANVVFTMCIVHYFQIFTLYMIFRKIFDFHDFILGINKLYIGLFLIAFFVVYYFLFFRRDKWDHYAQQVNKEGKSKRRKGKILVLIYTLVPISMIIGVNLLTIS